MPAGHDAFFARTSSCWYLFVLKEFLQLPQPASAPAISVGRLQLTRVEDKDLRVPFIGDECKLHHVAPIAAVFPHFPLCIQPDDRFPCSFFDFRYQGRTCTIDTAQRVMIDGLHVFRELQDRERLWDLYIPQNVRKALLKHRAVVDLVREDTLKKNTSAPDALHLII
jgi:hypothetical protein